MCFYVTMCYYVAKPKTLNLEPKTLNITKGKPSRIRPLYMFNFCLSAYRWLNLI